jgi:signal peptidase I
MSVPTWVIGAKPARTLLRAAVVLGLATVVFGWILKPVRMFGPSMEPTFRSGHFGLVYSLAYRTAGPARGDVVAIRMAGPSVLYVKRVIGLPGERLRIDQGRVIINGVPLDEPAVHNPAPWILAELTLDRDEYFVVGDNRRMPMRDHELGRVRADRVVGKVVF